MKRKIVAGLIKLLFGAFVFFGVRVSFAQEVSSDQLTSDSSSKPVKVLQNRFFKKTWRPEIGLLAGSMLSESYTNTTLTGVRFSLFISEWIGFEAQSIGAQVSDSEDRKALNENEYRDLNSDDIVYADVPVNEIKGITDFTLNYAPFYGKLNLLDKFIIYSDLYFTVGGSRVNTVQGQKTATTLGFGQKYYIGKAFSVRLDLRNRNYAEDRNGRSVTKKTLSLDIGFGYFFF